MSDYFFFSVAGIEFKGQKRPEEIPKAKNLVDNFDETWVLSGLWQ